MARSIVGSVLPGLVLALAGLSGHAAQPPQPKTTPALSDAFLAAKTACEGRRHAECIARAREILASARKSADDVYAANSYIMRAASAQNDTRAMVEAMEGMIDSGFDAGPAATNQIRQALAAAHFRLKNYPQAIRHGTELIRSGGAGEDVYTVVGQSYYQTRNFAEAIKLFSGLVAGAERAGRRPDRNQLSLLYSAYDKSGNANAAQATLEKLVRFYPTADTWLVLLYEVKREKLEPRLRLHLYRLMESTGNLREGADVLAYYGAATAVKLHNEASRVLAMGLKNNVFAKSPEDLKRAERYIKSARTQADADRAGLQQLEAQARSAPDGEAYVTLGMQQLAFEMYPQAVASLKAGLAKGGLKDAVDAQMTLGEAQFRAGQKGEAVKTFRAIQGGDGIAQRLIKFWTLHVQ